MDELSSSARYDLIKEVMQQYEEETFKKLAVDNHDLQLLYLVDVFSTFVKNEQTSVDVNNILFHCDVSLNYTWEDLNLGQWKNVGIETKQIFAVVSFMKAVVLLLQGNKDCLQKSLKTVDRGILLGHPVSNLNLAIIADVLNEKLQTKKEVTHCKFNQTCPENIETPNLKFPNLKVLECPSLENFYQNYFKVGKPVKLSNCIEHWPALEKWKDVDYLVSVMGMREVPIEIGKHYADESYSQKIMKCSEFIKQYFGDGPGRDVGYLAQHQLFDQVPALKADIRIPEYCALSEEEIASEPDINAWFGPRGTVSPLHYDPKNNILVQVVGYKVLTLFPESDTLLLYPHEDELLFNTSRVDVECPDLNNFPMYAKANGFICKLGPGDMVFMPKKLWHHVRALSDSFSVSFWW